MIFVNKYKTIFAFLLPRIFMLIVSTLQRLLNLEWILQVITNIAMLFWLKGRLWQVLRLIKSHLLNNTAETLHHCGGCSQVMGCIFITNHSSRALYCNQIDFPASDLLNEPHIRLNRERLTPISHSGQAVPRHSRRKPALRRYTLTAPLLDGG